MHEKENGKEKCTVFNWKKANLNKSARYSYSSFLSSTKNARYSNVALLSLSLCLVIFHCLFSGQIYTFMDVYCLSVVHLTFYFLHLVTRAPSVTCSIILREVATCSRNVKSQREVTTWSHSALPTSRWYV
jgi:hypothetical protein